MEDIDIAEEMIKAGIEALSIEDTTYMPDWTRIVVKVFLAMEAIRVNHESMRATHLDYLPDGIPSSGVINFSDMSKDPPVGK